MCLYVYVCAHILLPTCVNLKRRTSSTESSFEKTSETVKSGSSSLFTIQYWHNHSLTHTSAPAVTTQETKITMTLVFAAGNAHSYGCHVNPAATARKAQERITFHLKEVAGMQWQLCSGVARTSLKWCWSQKLVSMSCKSLFKQKLVNTKGIHERSLCSDSAGRQSQVQKK